MTDFYLRFLEKCNEVNKKPSAVVVALGLSKSAVTRWKAGNLPTDATVKKIADYFGTTSEWMLGDGEQKNPAATPGDGLDAEFREKYEMLTDEQKKLIEQVIDNLIGGRK